MTTPLQIFNHQQSLVSRSVVVVNRHQEACALLLASLPNPRPESAFPRTIDCSVAWNTGYLLEAAAPHLQIAASPESRVFVALASVVDEIHSLARWLQDYAFAWLTADAKSLDLLVDASRAGKRMCLLVRNLVAQLEGLQRVKPSGFKPEAVPLWVALARAMQTLASMDALRPSLGLVAEALAQDLVQVSANTRAWGAKALHRLLDACQAPDEALAAAGLYVLLHRLGHTQDQALFGRVWSLQLRLAPVVWIRRRVVLKLDEFLSRHAPPPTSSVKKPQDPGAARRAMAAVLTDQLPKAAKRAAFECGARPSVDLAERARRFLDLFIALHASESLPVPQTSLNHVLVLVGVLRSLDRALAHLPAPPASAANSARALTPSKAVALWVVAGEGLAPPPTQFTQQRHAARLCDVSELLRGFPELAPALLAECFASAQCASRLGFCVEAFCDCEEEEEAATAGEERGLEAALETHVVGPLAGLVEDTLRRAAAASLPPAASCDPWELFAGAQNDKARALFHLPPLFVAAARPRVWLKARVERALARRFHAFCALDLRRRNLYADMARRAWHVYGLCVATDPLLPRTSPPKLGPLEVMRDVDAFAQQFAYNLNQEFFVEKASAPSAVQLGLVSVDSVLRAVHVHGSGVLATVVNACYQFLVRKFELLSQLLYEDAVKSYLKRERRWFAKEKALGALGCYPAARALTLAKDAKPALGAQFVPRLRAVVTEIGNVFGFVRLLKSAAAKWDAGRLASLGPGALGSPGAAGMPAATSRDFVAVLMDVFRTFFSKDSVTGEHLKSAFMVFPALTLDHVDSSLHAKDLVARGKQHKLAYFTDDGFAVGMAAVLSVLSQNSAFENLAWFQSIVQWLGQGEDKEEGSRRRARGVAREHEMLMFALSGAVVLFKRDKDKLEELQEV